jgi:hypothetical protein
LSRTAKPSASSHSARAHFATTAANTSAKENEELVSKWGAGTRR